MNIYRDEIVLPEADKDTGYSTVRVFESPTINVQRGGTHAYSTPRASVVSVEFKDVGLRFRGGAGLAEVVDTILARKLDLGQATTEAALTEAVMQYVGVALGWQRILREFSECLQAENDYAHKRGHREARAQLYDWLSGGGYKPL